MLSLCSAIELRPLRVAPTLQVQMAMPHLIVRHCNIVPHQGLSGMVLSQHVVLLNSSMACHNHKHWFGGDKEIFVWLDDPQTALQESKISVGLTCCSSKLAAIVETKLYFCLQH